MEEAGNVAVSTFAHASFTANGRKKPRWNWETRGPGGLNTDGGIKLPAPAKVKKRAPRFHAKPKPPKFLNRTQPAIPGPKFTLRGEPNGTRPPRARCWFDGMKTSAARHHQTSERCWISNSAHTREMKPRGRPPPVPRTDGRKLAGTFRPRFRNGPRRTYHVNRKHAKIGSTTPIVRWFRTTSLRGGHGYRARDLRVGRCPRIMPTVAVRGENTKRPASHHGSPGKRGRRTMIQGYGASERAPPARPPGP